LNQTKKKGLSTGAKVGIAFAVLIALLAIIALMIFWVRRRRQNYTPVPPIVVNDGDGDGDEDGRHTPPPVQQMGAGRYRVTPIPSTAYAPIS